jgi:uncharacterized protein
MLFGAGLVLMAERADARGVKLGKVYYRRVGVLLGIGLIHAYLIWSGDILVPYALCGLFLYPLRRKSARTLVVVGLCLIAVSVPAWLLGRVYILHARAVSARVEAQFAAGEEPSKKDREIRDGWVKMREGIGESPEKFEAEVRAYRGGYFGVLRERAGEVFQMQVFGFFLFFWYMVGGRMLLGMGLMKLGVFSAARTPRFYRRMALIGYGIGLPLVLCDIAADWYYNFFINKDLLYFTGGWWMFQELSSPLIALGHVAMVMLLFKSGAVPWLVRRLAAVGRMALTNYLLTSIICTTIFYGYGFGLYGRLHRPSLYLVVFGVWAFLFAISLPWLERFRFGPAEWAWRSLTYGRSQPFRRRDVAVS